MINQFSSFTRSYVKRTYETPIWAYQPSTTQKPMCPGSTWPAWCWTHFFLGTTHSNAKGTYETPILAYQPSTTQKPMCPGSTWPTWRWIHWFLWPTRSNAQINFCKLALCVPSWYCLKTNGCKIILLAERAARNFRRARQDIKLCLDPVLSSFALLPVKYDLCKSTLCIYVLHGLKTNASRFNLDVLFKFLISVFPDCLIFFVMSTTSLISYAYYPAFFRPPQIFFLEHLHFGAKFLTNRYVFLVFPGLSFIRHLIKIVYITPLLSRLRGWGYLKLFIFFWTFFKKNRTFFENSLGYNQLILA